MKRVNLYRCWLALTVQGSNQNKMKQGSDKPENGTLVIATSEKNARKTMAESFCVNIAEVFTHNLSEQGT